ncbi:glyceraldehyde 3-phosphate dehydrogenase [Firmicutes bacterium CAG:102]|nr:glyceraldehyde 3-phosphate dehydrogenase [Firmicutes bacterium CAG:102]
MNSAHQTLFDTERVIYDFNQRCQAVCCTGCIGNDIHVLSVCLVVYANNKGRCNLILSGCCQDNLLSAADFVQRSLFHCIERTCGFDDVFCTTVCPLNQRSIAFTENVDFLTVYNQAVLADFDIAFKATEDRVIFQLICHIIQFCISQVNTAKFKFILTLHQNSEYNSADTTKTIDANFNCH